MAQPSPQSSRPLADLPRRARTLEVRSPSPSSHVCQGVQPAASERSPSLAHARLGSTRDRSQHLRGGGARPPLPSTSWEASGGPARTHRDALPSPSREESPFPHEAHEATTLPNSGRRVPRGRRGRGEGDEGRPAGSRSQKASPRQGT